MMILNFLFLFVLISGTNCFYFNDTPYLEQIKNNENGLFQTYYDPFYNQSIALIRTLSNSNELNQKCRNSLKRWSDAIEDKEAWALKFLDATGKTIDSKLLGRNVNFGSFQFCKSFVKEDAENVDFDGKYCFVSVQTQESEIIKSSPRYQAYHNSISDSSKRVLNFNIGNNHGVCVPSTCDINELASIVNKMFRSSGFSVLPPKKCTTISEPEKWDYLQLFSLTILCSSIFLCFLSFFVKNKFLSNFSLVDHFNYIYDTNPDVQPNYLHEPKAVMMILSIMAHSSIYGSFYFSSSFASIKEFKMPEYLQVFCARFLLLASQMFFLGGFFSMISWYDIIKKEPKKFSFFNYIKTRYIRIFIISIPITLIAFILPHLGSGPYFSDLTNHFYENCRRNGYKIFFLSSNINDRIVDMCLPGNWYLSADFQLAILCYLILYYLVVKPKLAFIIILVLSFISSLLVYLYNSKILGLTTIFNLYDFYVWDVGRLQDVYFPAFYHFNVYALGILCAYLIKTGKKPKIWDYQIVKIIIFLVLVSLNFWILLYPYRIEQNKSTGNVILVTLHQLYAESIVTCSIFFYLYTAALSFSKNSKSIRSKASRSSLWLFFKTVSESRFWIPWSKLSFSITLSQFLMIQYLIAARRDHFSYSPIQFIEQMLNSLLTSFLFAKFVYLFFEGPLVSMFKTYFNYESRSKQIEKFIKSNGIESEKVDFNMNIKQE